MTIAEADARCDADMMVAVHAWRSAASITRFAEARPDRPLVVCLAGTDIYRFLHSHAAETLASMDRASALVCLHGLVHRALPRRFHDKLRVIHQSAAPLAGARRPSVRTFDVCVIGHLREEKDSLRSAYAARLVPEGSRLRIIQLGKAHDQGWADTAAREMASNERFVWQGEVSGAAVRRQFQRSHAMVISSVMEGGANVVSEAIVGGVPVIASNIEGNTGLLGEDYAGTYPVGDTEALAAMLWKSETETRFLARLQAQCRKRAPLFHPDREQAAWRALLADLGG